MKLLLQLLGGLGLVIGLASFAGAADTTMTGKISDSMCGASHAKMLAGHPGWTDRDCAQACIKGGGKYVFVSTDGKVYNISNQSEAGLANTPAKMPR